MKFIKTINLWQEIHKSLLIGNIQILATFNFGNSQLMAISNFGNFQFWQLSILATFNFDNFQFWQLSILAIFNSSNFQFWQFSILAIFKQNFWIDPRRTTTTTTYRLYGSCDQKGWVGLFCQLQLCCYDREKDKKFPQLS